MVRFSVKCLDIIIEKNLREKSWGIFEGKERKKFLDHPFFMIHSDIDRRYKNRPPKGESHHDLELRVRPIIKKILESKNENILIVSHSGTIRTILRYLLKLNNEQLFNLEIKNSSLTILEIRNKKIIPILMTSVDY